MVGLAHRAVKPLMDSRNMCSRDGVGDIRSEDHFHNDALHLHQLLADNTAQGSDRAGGGLPRDIRRVGREVPRRHVSGPAAMGMRRRRQQGEQAAARAARLMR